MGTLTIDGDNYTELADGFNPGPTTGTYYCLPPYGHPPRVGAAENEIMHVSFPGVDGVWRKKMGFRGRPIFIQLATMNTGKDGAWNDVEDLFTKFNKFERYTIVFPDSIQFDGCALIPGGGEVFDEFAFAGDDENRVCILTSWQFRQYSFDNA